MGMQMGSSTRAAAPKMREGKKQGLNRKRFKDFYTNAIATSGDCKATVSGSFSAKDGTVTFRKGCARVRFVSDDSSIDTYLSLRKLSSSVISRGAHLIVFDA